MPGVSHVPLPPLQSHPLHSHSVLLFPDYSLLEVQILLPSLHEHQPSYVKVTTCCRYTSSAYSATTRVPIVSLVVYVTLFLLCHPSRCCMYAWNRRLLSGFLFVKVAVSPIHEAGDRSGSRQGCAIVYLVRIRCFHGQDCRVHYDASIHHVMFNLDVTSSPAAFLIARVSHVAATASTVTSLPRAQYC